MDRKIDRWTDRQMKNMDTWRWTKGWRDSGMDWRVQKGGKIEMADRQTPKIDRQKDKQTDGQKTNVRLNMHTDRHKCRQTDDRQTADNIDVCRKLNGNCRLSQGDHVIDWNDWHLPFNSRPQDLKASPTVLISTIEWRLKSSGFSNTTTCNLFSEEKPEG